MKPTHKKTLPRWERRCLLAGLAILLLLLGQFEEVVFAKLTQLWQVILNGLAFPASQSVSQLSTHTLPVAVSYRLLYASISVLALHLLLRGRGTFLIANSYIIALVVSFLLLLLGQRAAFPFATQQAHQLIDLVCSPLAIAFVYTLATLSKRPPTLAGNSSITDPY